MKKVEEILKNVELPHSTDAEYLIDLLELKSNVERALIAFYQRIEYHERIKGGQ